MVSLRIGKSRPISAALWNWARMFWFSTVVPGSGLRSHLSGRLVLFAGPQRASSRGSGSSRNVFRLHAVSDKAATSLLGTPKGRGCRMKSITRKIGALLQRLNRLEHVAGSVTTWAASAPSPEPRTLWNATCVSPWKLEWKKARSSAVRAPKRTQRYKGRFLRLGESGNS